MAAVVGTSAGLEGRPRVLALAAFDGEQATAQMLQWHQKLARAHRGEPNLLLENHDYQLMVLDTPAVALDERREAMRWQVRDLIDFPVEEAALDCVEIPATQVGEKAQKLLTVVSKRSVVAQWMRRFQAGELPLTSIDVPELALRNIALLAGQDSGHAYLHVGLESTRLLMLWQRNLCAFRQLDLNASQWAHADKFERQELAERLALEIQRSADAFARQYHAADFTHLWVSGAGDAATLVAALMPLVTMPVKALSLPDWMDWEGAQPVMDLSQRIDYTFAIGAALRAREDAS